MKSAVIIEEPTPTTLRVEPLIVATAVVADAYAKDPGIAEASVGAISVSGEAPKL